MINSKDITFVIQGEIYKDIISESINNIHKFFPEAEIIISTWDGSNLDGIDCPNIILNPDRFRRAWLKRSMPLRNCSRHATSTVSKDWEKRESWG